MALGFILGWPIKQKDVGTVSPGYCDNCRNSSMWHLMKTRRWGTIFFIPLLPLSSSDWYLVCDICGASIELDGDLPALAKETIEHTKAFANDEISEDEYWEKINVFTAALKDIDLEQLEKVQSDDIEVEEDIRGIQ